MKTDSDSRPARFAASRLLALLLVVSMLVSACGPDLSNVLTDPTTKMVDVLDNAINVLSNASSSWQTVLQDIVAQLTDEAQATVRNEVTDLMNRGIASAGAELRCDADFLRNRVRQGLLAIKARLLGQPAPASEPALCQVVPLAVDMTRVPNSLKLLELYGYDFDTTPIQVMLINSNGQVDVSDKLARPTHYHMTLNLGANGVPLTAASQRLVLRWQNHDISTISVIQPATPVCRVDIKTFTPQAITYQPPRTRGDREFDGNGPKVTASAVLINLGYQVDVQVSMTAKETSSDWTTASGSMTTRIFTPDPGWKVLDIIGGLESTKSYIDGNHQLDPFGLGSGGPANLFEFIGDDEGDDAGVHTQVNVKFNELRFQLVQTTNCVSPSAIKQAQSLSTFSSAVLQRLTQDAQFMSLQDVNGLPALPVRP